MGGLGQQLKGVILYVSLCARQRFFKESAIRFLQNAKRVEELLRKEYKINSQIFWSAAVQKTWLRKTKTNLSTLITT